MLQYYQKWVFNNFLRKLSQKKVFSEHFNKNQLIYHFKTKIVEQNKIVAKMWVYLIFKLHQYETNDFYIKNIQNFCIEYWFRRETVFAGKLVSQENLFFVTFAKITFANHYTCGGNKLHIMQKLVTLQFCDFLTNKEDGSNWQKIS